MSGSDPRAAQVVWRARVLAGCLLLAAVAFLQAGGRVAPDTKLDLTVDPVAFLLRSLHVWDASQLGQLQNQAYGYWWPIGPVHAVLRTLLVPEWVTQRLWWTIVLITAFLGFWRLARAVGVGGPWSRYLGALLYALSPRMLAEVAVTSIEVWPYAVAPWVILPLVDPRPRRPWQRIVLSAAAFGCVGGVNAVATGAVLVIPTLWWVTRARSLRAARDGLAWLGACLLTGAWWLGPLLVLGRFSPPFLDWIENAPATTSTASAFSALQGTTAWLTYLRVPSGPTWPAGWQLVAKPLLVAVSTAPAVVGLVGLALPRLREGAWWRLCALTGLVLLTLGFAGPAHGPLVGVVQDLLDGPLAALRNIHKFELVVRIPLLIGLVHALHRLGAVTWAAPSGRRSLAGLLPRPVAGVLAGALVVAAAGPAFATTLPRQGTFTQVPDYWRDAARWLDAQPGPGSVLVVPAAPFAELTWGAPRDEPLQALMRRPFAVRDAVPLGSAGATRLLDEVERSLRTGVAVPGLRTALADAGIRYLVVRGDLRAAARSAPPLAVHQALADAGIPRARAFGPASGSTLETPDLTLDERTLLPYPSVEVYDVGPVEQARLIPVAALRSVTGGPEDLPYLARALPARVGVLGHDVDTLLGGATGGAVRAALPGGRLREVLTDGNQEREVSFGRASDNRSPVLAADDPGTTGRRVRDYLVDPRARRTVLRWEGVAGVAASSSTADAGSLLHASVGDGPAAALDGDPATRWRSGVDLPGARPWLEIRLDRPRDLRGTTVTLARPAPGAALPTTLETQTDSGTAATLVPFARPMDPLTLQLPPGPTTRLRVRLRTLGPGADAGLAITQLTVPGILPVPRLQLPGTPSGTPDVVSLRRQEPGRDGCLRQGGRPLCAAGLIVAGEEQVGLFRGFTTAAPRRYAWSGTVRPRATPQAAALLEPPVGVRATATSSRVPSLLGRPGAVVDGDLGTGWVASAEDPAPTLTLRLPTRRRIGGLVLRVDQHLAAARPTRVTVRLGGRALDRTVGPDGTVRLPPTVTDRVDLVLREREVVRSVEAATGIVQHLPAGVSEVQLLGAQDLVRGALRTAPVGAACGSGPTLTVDGIPQPTRLVGTVGDLLAGRAVRWIGCGNATLALGAGDHRVDAPAAAAWQPESLQLVATDAAVAAAPASGIPLQDGRYRLPARSTPAVLALPHNANDGWVAVDGSGAPLQPVRLDGRAQGWLVPAGEATWVRESYAPQQPYAFALAAGLLLLAGLLVLAVRILRHPREGSAPLPAASWAGPAVAVLAVPALGLAWGLTGMTAACGGILLGGACGWLARRRAAGQPAVPPARWAWPAALLTTLPALLAGCAGAAAVALVCAQPWGAGGAALRSWWVQALVLGGFALAVARSCPDPARGRGRSDDVSAR
ncbi:alpha-(1-_3)-arabinofuranosyltransferase domain-containing protein [Arsenicicoccus dermatophilus]|uniref:alpha-(1->3)-arabinofuranosyltransferase domain-containing protein n=1 Tax=Arsenicicoccus dermatophilus TaxID=1076331 RepID=UPI001F4CD7D2|nr:alpha-(1->3)-arabinofuranosyltransferase family protein [Arsenicicoccus dermatophilus]MCH8614031.1 alpha-(1->3)-arabinofuranosyltransferase [Arsenicicoccus dermatophilus]